LDDFLLLSEGAYCAPTQVTARDALSKVPCVCGHPAPDCRRHSIHRVSGRFRHPPGLYPRMDAHKGFGGHGKAGGPYYSTKEADAIRQKEKEDLENLIAGQSTDAEDESSTVDKLAQDTQVRFGGTTTLSRTPSSGTRSSPLLVEESLCDTLVSTTRASRTGPKTNPKAHIWYGLLDVAGKRWVVQEWSTAWDYVTSQGFQYHHVFYSQDEANGWKNFVNAQNSNLKAPPPGTHKTKKVMVMDDSSSDSSDNPEAISKKPGRIPSTASAVGPEEEEVTPLPPLVRAIPHLITATTPPLVLPALVTAELQDRDAETRSIIASDAVTGGPTRTKARTKLDTAPGATQNNAASEVLHTSASTPKAGTTEQTSEDLILW
jgi:hypothetical protein